MNPEKLRVLVIDDEAQMRRLLQRTLESGGYHYFEAEHGKAGMDQAVQAKPDLIILDLGLPDLDGVEVLRRIREWSRVPILILSVRDDEKQKVAALDAGADDYITKPFGQEELLARLRVIQRRISAEPNEPVFEDGNLKVDWMGHLAFVNGKEIHVRAEDFNGYLESVLQQSPAVTDEGSSTQSQSQI